MELEDQDMNEYRVAQCAEIVAAYVSNNPLSTADLPELIQSVHGTLAGLGQPQVEPAEEPRPAVPIKKSVQHHHVVCLECGKGLRSLKRHIGARHQLSPDEYRDKWRLPAGYPMVAPQYSEKRSYLAKENGLGKNR